MKMKKVPCSYVDCGSRRKHWEDPEPRGYRRMIEVPEDFNGPAYCSIECQVYDKSKYNPVEDVFTK